MVPCDVRCTIAPKIILVIEFKMNGKWGNVYEHDALQLPNMQTLKQKIFPGQEIKLFVNILILGFIDAKRIAEETI